ncbi:MAG TPA: protein-disulfide reductase DsbD domain-containing protein [Thermodesulfobacteriota bacterium]
MLTSMFFAFYFFSSINSFAEELPKPVKTELIADVSRIKAGEAFKIGVRFKIEPNWHIYWKNPGDSGLPTSVNFVVPHGFIVGDLRWPIPMIFKRPGDIEDFGYEASLLLFAEVKTPSDLSNNETIPIKAEATWTSCSDICIPGKSNLEVSILPTDSVTHANRSLFGEWETRLPKNYDARASPFIALIEGRMNNDQTDSNITVSLDWRKKPLDVDWIPAPVDELEIDNIQMNKRNDKTDITFEASAYPGQKLDSDSLESLVLYVDKDGRRNGTVLQIPLKGNLKN